MIGPEKNGGAELRAHVLRECHNPRSVTGLLFLDDDPQKEVLHFKRSTDASVLGLEVDELYRAEAVTQGVEGIRPLRIRSYLPEQGMLLTEYIRGGQTLFNYLWNGSSYLTWRRFSSPTPRELGTRLGRWLRAYHFSTQACPREPSLFTSHIARDARAKLDALCRHNRGCVDLENAEAIRSYLSRAAEGGIPVEGQLAARIHGDLEPANIQIAKDGTVFVLDFADCRQGLAVEDFARLWHAIWAMSRVSSRRGRMLQPCLAALLAEYELTGGSLDSPALLLIRCWNALCALATISFVRDHIGFISRQAMRHLGNVQRAWLTSIEW